MRMNVRRCCCLELVLSQERRRLLGRSRLLLLLLSLLLLALLMLVPERAPPSPLDGYSRDAASRTPATRCARYNGGAHKRSNRQLPGEPRCLDQ